MKKCSVCHTLADAFDVCLMDRVELYDVMFEQSISFYTISLRQRRVRENYSLLCYDIEIYYVPSIINNNFFLPECCDVIDFRTSTRKDNDTFSYNH